MCVPWHPNLFGSRQSLLNPVTANKIGLTGGIAADGKSDRCTSHSQYDRYDTCYMYPRGVRIDNYIIAEQHSAVWTQLGDLLRICSCRWVFTARRMQRVVAECMQKYFRRPCTQINKPRVSIHSLVPRHKYGSRKSRVWQNVDFQTLRNYEITCCPPKNSPRQHICF